MGLNSLKCIRNNDSIIQSEDTSIPDGQTTSDEPNDPLIEQFTNLHKNLIIKSC